MDLIESFIEQYEKEFDYYSEVSKLCGRECEIALKKAGIRAIVTSRAKQPDSLREKLTSRNKKNAYKSSTDMRNDIVDFAGVRIALYFPSARKEVDHIIRSNFILAEDPKEFPSSNSNNQSMVTYNKRFSGYHATHYRVLLKQNNNIVYDQRFYSAKIEIQVASVLMHAWSEVEHDLIYKPLSGNLSDDEHSILDELNGMVLSGEIALERLSSAIKRRVELDSKSFSNHFELASYLYENFAPARNNEPLMGNVELLFQFLRHIKFDKPSKINKYITKLKSGHEQIPIVNQVVDTILSEHNEFYSVYRTILADINAKTSKLNKYHTLNDIGDDFKQAFFSFIQTWNHLENNIRKELLDNVKHKNKVISPLMIQDYILDRDTGHDFISTYKKIRRLRNELVHGTASATIEDINDAEKFLSSLNDFLFKHTPFQNKI